MHAFLRDDDCRFCGRQAKIRPWKLDLLSYPLSWHMTTAVLRITDRKQRLKTLQRFQGTTEAKVEKTESVLGQSKQHPSHYRHSARPISFSLKVRNLQVVMFAVLQ